MAAVFYEENRSASMGLITCCFWIEEIWTVKGSAENGECRHLVKMDPVKTKEERKNYAS